MRDWTCGLLFCAKFQHDRYIETCGVKSRRKVVNLTKSEFCDSCTNSLYYTPLTDQGQIWHASVDQWYMLFPGKFHFGRFIVSPLMNVKPEIWPYFQIQPSVLAPSGGKETKLNAGAHLQTFPYPTISKSLLNSDGLMAIMRATLPFKCQGQIKTN